MALPPRVFNLAAERAGVGSSLRSTACTTAPRRSLSCAARASPLTPGLGAGFYVGNGFLRPRGPECFGENTLASHVTAAYLKREHRL